MILIDFSGITISTVFACAKHEICEDLLRHQILNNIRALNLKYRDKFGETIICCDGGSWRKDYFPQYKAARKKAREKSDLDWTEIFRIIGKVRDEITEFMPYRVLSLQNVEADDIIATLVETTQEFGANEDVMIISSDHDFIQLQKYSNVYQYSPNTKKLLTEKDPQKFLMEHVMRGCSSDGVPNVKSDDRVFVDNIRQTSISSKKIDEWFSAYKENKMESVLTEDEYKHFKRNKQMIDLSQIPDAITKPIWDAYRDAPLVGNSKIFNYLIANRCVNLIECAEDFFVK